MATLFKKPGSKNWYARWTVDGRQHRPSTGTSNFELAKQYAAKLEYESHQQALGFATKKTTLGEICEAYWDVKKQTLSANGYDGMINAWVEHFGRNTRCRDITQRKVENYLAQLLDEGKTPATRNRYLSCLKAVFKKAHGWKLVDDNPCVGIPMLKEVKRMRWLSVAEITTFLQLAPERTYAFFMAAIHTGMRRGELFSLRWLDVNFESGRILVRGETTKTGASREIRMGQTLYAHLLQMSRGKAADGPVFECTLGEVRGDFKRLVNQMKLKDFRFHDLRHTFAVQLRLKGVDIHTIKKLLGHREITMTLRYQELGPKDDLSDQAIDRAFGSSQPPSQTPQPYPADAQLTGETERPASPAGRAAVAPQHSDLVH